MSISLIKKYLLWIGCAIIMISTIVLIAVNVAPYKTNSPYSYKISQSGNTIEASISLDNVGTAVIEYKVNGTIVDGSTTTFKYLVSDGTLFEYDEDDLEYKVRGTISASKITLIGDGISLNFQNNATITTNTIFIILLVLGIISVSAYGVIVYLEKKKNKTIKEQKTELLDKID